MITSAGASVHSGRMLLRWLLRVLGLAFALAVAGALAVVVVIPRATHGQAMTVLTGSMTPGIPVGSVVVVRPVDPSSLKVGDVATYQREPGKKVFITHRIVKIDDRHSPTRFTFKGDANRGPDIKPVVAQQIRGQVWFHVGYLGAIRDGLHGKGGITLVAMLLLAGYALSQLAGGLRERRAGGPSEPVELPLDRHLVVASVDTSRLTSRFALAPAAAAAQCGGVLVHEDDDACTLVITVPALDLGARLELLADLGPRRITVLDGNITITGRASTPPLETAVDTSVEA